MKKLLLLPILLLTACHKSSIPIFRFEEKYYTSENKGLVELNDIDSFLELENSKESFGIYIYTPGCISCNNFKPILETFLDENNLQIYSISYSKLKDKSNTLKKNIEYAPSVALFYEGELATYLDAQKEEHIEYYETKQGLAAWFTMYIDIKSTSK